MLQSLAADLSVSAAGNLFLRVTFTVFFSHLLSFSSQAEAGAPLKLGCSKEPLNFHLTLRCSTAAPAPGRSRRLARPGSGRGLFSSPLSSAALPGSGEAAVLGHCGAPGRGARPG